MSIDCLDTEPKEVAFMRRLVTERPEAGQYKDWDMREVVRYIDDLKNTIREVYAEAGGC